MVIYHTSIPKCSTQIPYANSASSYRGGVRELLSGGVMAGMEILMGTNCPAVQGGMGAGLLTKGQQNYTVVVRNFGPFSGCSFFGINAERFFIEFRGLLKIGFFTRNQTQSKGCTTGFNCSIVAA